MKIVISAESTIDLPQEMLDKFDIHTTPFTINFNDELVEDHFGVSKEIFEFVDKTKKLPKTSAVSPDQFQTHFVDLKKDYDAIIHVSLSSLISSAYNNACLVAKDMENVFVVLIPEIIIWLICQKNIFGKVFMNNISELDMIKYGDWFSHCIAVPIMYLAELVIVTVIAGIVPMFIISRMKVAEVIKPVD